MSIIDWFSERRMRSSTSDKLNIPGDLWVKCFNCKEILFLKDLESNMKVCMKCDYHFRITPQERLSIIVDRDSFEESDADVAPIDFLEFEDTELYKNRIKKAQEKSGRKDAILIGKAKLHGKHIRVGVMDFGFMGGSMGSVVGEKVTRLIEAGLKEKVPVILFTSSGGARMQEGVMSLMQMGKTSAALGRLADASVPFLSVLCDPTTGGTSASFAMLGDINIAEPGALISFAGPRVIEQTIRQKLPKGFQRAEFLKDHGMVDMVLNRKDMRDTLYQLVSVLDPNSKFEGAGK